MRSTYHSFAVDSHVDLPLSGSLQNVFGRDATGDLQSVEEHLAVKAVPCSLQTWSNTNGYRKTADFS